MPYLSKKRLYLTADGTVVEGDDPAAATLLVGEGCELDDATAEQYGLTATASKAKSAPPENKVLTAAPENKSKPAAAKE